MSLRSPYLDDSKVYAPLGLLYLKSAVEQETDVNVDIVDDYDLTKPETFKPYDTIGLSVMTPQREEALKVLKTVKENYPDKKVIVGGPHALHYTKELMNAGFDHIVRRDGQRDLVKILNGESERVLEDKMGKADWMSQPRPDRTSKKAKDFLSSYNYELKGRKGGTMLTATGCPMACTFCEDAMTAVRWSPLEKLSKEMDDLKDLGYKGVYLFDDLFAIAMPMVEPICNELFKRDLIYRCNGQANYFTKWGEDFAKMLSDTGCVEIAFGHESGSQKILDNVKKRTSVEQNYQSVEFAKKHGIKVKSFLMLGLPGEDYNTMKETEQFIKNTQPDDFQIAIYYPYKGTQIRDSIDRGEQVDLMFEGEGLGAYGQKGGKTESVVRTKAISSENLMAFRDYLVETYKPKSHSHFFDTNQKSEVEYE